MQHVQAAGSGCEHRGLHAGSKHHPHGEYSMCGQRRVGADIMGCMQVVHSMCMVYAECADSMRLLLASWPHVVLLDSEQQLHGMCSMCR